MRFSYQILMYASKKSIHPQDCLENLVTFAQITNAAISTGSRSAQNLCNQTHTPALDCVDCP